MGALIYSAITSLDGFVADTDGNFGWAMPSAEVHQYINDLERPVGTYLYGRRMYEVMSYWETTPDEPDTSPIERDYAAIWQAADKVVYSRTLTSTRTARSRLESAFDPEAVATMKLASERAISVGGPHLAAQLLRAGLVDELHLFLAPVVVGGGNAALPSGVRLSLTLVEQRRFEGGFVHLHYAVGQGGGAD